MSDVRALRVEHRRGAVSGVVGVATECAGKPVMRRVTLRAKVVVSSASAVGSPTLALASGLPILTATSGRACAFTRAAAVAGFFDETLDGVYGIPQSYECTEYPRFRRGERTPGLDHHGLRAPRRGRELRCPVSARRIWRSCDATRTWRCSPRWCTMKPQGAFPWAKRRAAASATRSSTAIALSSCSGSRGQRESSSLQAPARWSWRRSRPLRLTRESRSTKSPSDLVGPHQMPLLSVHPMGTMRLGEDPRASVVKSTGEHHHVDRFVRARRLAFPTSIGVPPQISIYAFARHLAQYVIDRAR